MTTKDHTMPNVVRIALTLLCLFGSWSPVQAWVTEEHILIGEAGYRLACEGFRDPQVVRTEAQRKRAQQFCFQDPDLARHYGEITAYGGDYAAEPEDIPTDFDTMSAQLAELSDRSHIKNLLHRAKLALKDGTHFQPHAEEQWWHYHQRILLKGGVHLGHLLYQKARLVYRLPTTALIEGGSRAANRLSDWHHDLQARPMLERLYHLPDHNRNRSRSH